MMASSNHLGNRSTSATGHVECNVSGTVHGAAKDIVNITSSRKVADGGLCGNSSGETVTGKPVSALLNKSGGGFYQSDRPAILAWG